MFNDHVILCQDLLKTFFTDTALEARTTVRTLGDFARDDLEHFIYEDDRKRYFQHREPLLEVQWGDLEDSLNANKQRLKG